MLARVSRAQPPSPFASLAASVAPATWTKSAPRMPIVSPRRKCDESSASTRARGSPWLASKASPHARRRARLGRDRRNPEGNLRDPRLLQQIEYVNDALVLDRAVGLDDGAKVGASRVGLFGLREESVVVGELLLIDGDVAVRVKLDRENDLHVGAG